MICGRVSNGLTQKELRSFDRVVVKVSDDDFQREISMFLLETGEVECRYFDGHGSSKRIFKGRLDDGDVDIWVDEDWND